ncbi:MAG: hypothetical protein EZS28_006644 [Streblomastix strix]|uniref:Kinesin motor domain-containing protein n=1 Tax=Streblomastix strix TaxID=222440 RepID=A0A5J4WSE2_9EUKA|nr:MAG: hypothetical protein EZS28_006644 [Streblomastix strix]
MEFDYSTDLSQSSNVVVCVRIRPEWKNERERGTNIIRTLEPNLVVFDPQEGNAIKGRKSTARRTESRFAFDRVFSETATQQEVFENSAKHLVPALLAGYNCSELEKLIL